MKKKIELHVTFNDGRTLCYELSKGETYEMRGGEVSIVYA